MINKYLIDAFEEFESKQTYKTLIEFAEKTFPKNGTDKLFIGCSLILITNEMSKYSATTHALLSILKCGKQKIGATNLLQIYYEKINTHKEVSRYLKKVIYQEDFDKNLDMLIDYFEHCSYNFEKIIRSYPNKIEKYNKL